jgi:PKD repeat protein
MSNHSGTAPLTIQFQNETTGQASSFLWDFDDGITSTSFNPVHVFRNPGTYNVTLTATGDGGHNVTMHTIVVEQAAPHAFFSTNLNSGDSPLTVGFTNESTGGFASGWFWDFDDGQTSTSEHATHTFTNPGTYNVTLTATGIDVPPSVYTKTIEVLVPAPIAKWEPDSWFGQIPLVINFQNLTTGQGPIDYLWEFGEGEGTSTEAEPSHTYNSFGTYTVVLTATGANGRSTRYMQLIGANLTPTTAFSVSPSEGDAPLTVDITNKTTGQVTSWAWAFGEDGALGGSSAEDPGQFTFNDPGVYPIQLSAIGNAGTSVASRDITVYGADPVASFSVPASIRVGDSVTVVNSSSNAFSYEWSWGNGLSSIVSYDGSTSSPAYLDAGDFTITLTAIATSGAQSTATHTVTVAAGSSSPAALFELKFTDAGDITDPRSSGTTITPQHGLETVQVDSDLLIDGSSSKVLSNIDNATFKIPNNSRIKIFNRSIPGSSADPIVHYKIEYALGDAELIRPPQHAGCLSGTAILTDGTVGFYGVGWTSGSGWEPAPRCEGAEVREHEGIAGLAYYPKFSIKTGDSAVVRIKLTVTDALDQTDSHEKVFRIWDLADPESSSATPAVSDAGIEAWPATYLGPFHDERDPLNKVTEKEDGGKEWGSGPFNFEIPSGPPDFDGGECAVHDVMVWRITTPPSWLVDILKDRTYGLIHKFGVAGAEHGTEGWFFTPANSSHVMAWKNGQSSWEHPNNMVFPINFSLNGDADESIYSPTGKSYTVTRNHADYDKLRLTYVKLASSGSSSRQFNIETLGVEYAGNTQKSGFFTGDDLSEIQIASGHTMFKLDEDIHVRGSTDGTPSHSWYGYRMGFFDEMWTGDGSNIYDCDPLQYTDAPAYLACKASHDAAESNEIIICERPDDIVQYTSAFGSRRINAERKGLSFEADKFGWIIWLYEEGKGVPYLGRSNDLNRSATPTDNALWDANNNGKYVISHLDYSLKKCGAVEAPTASLNSASGASEIGSNWDNIGTVPEILNTGATSAGTADFTISQYDGRGLAHLVKLENISKDSDGKCVRSNTGENQSEDTKIGGWKWTFDSPDLRDGITNPDSSISTDGGQIYPTSIGFKALPGNGHGYHNPWAMATQWDRRIRNSHMTDINNVSNERYQHPYIYSREIHNLWYSVASDSIVHPFEEAFPTAGPPGWVRPTPTTYTATYDGPWRWAKDGHKDNAFPYPIDQSAIFTGGPVGAYKEQGTTYFKNTATGYLLCESGDSNIVEHSFSAGIYYPSSLARTCKRAWQEIPDGPVKRTTFGGESFIEEAYLYAAKKGGGGRKMSDDLHPFANGPGVPDYTAENWWQGDKHTNKVGRNRTGDIKDAILKGGWGSNFIIGSKWDAPNLQEGVVYQIALEIWPEGGSAGDPNNSIRRKTVKLPAGSPDSGPNDQNYWPSNSLIHLDLLMKGWKYEPNWSDAIGGNNEGCWVSVDQNATWSPPWYMDEGFWHHSLGTLQPRIQQNWGTPN